MKQLCTRLLALYLKNCRLQIRQPFRSVFELLGPIFCCIIILYSRRQTKPISVEGQEFEAFAARDAIKNLKNFDMIMYAPNNRDIDEIMYHVKETLGLQNLLDFYNEEEMIRYSMGPGVLDRMLCAVAFKQDSYKDHLLGHKVHFKILFPPFMRKRETHYLKHHVPNWLTNRRYRALHYSTTLNEQPRTLDGKVIYSYPDEKGEIQSSSVDYMDTWKAHEAVTKKGLTKSIGLSNFNKNQIERVLTVAKIKPVDYYQEGFLAVQEAVSNGILNYFANINGIKSKAPPNITMHRLPYQNHVDDMWLESFGKIMGIHISSGFAITAICLIWDITNEKERHMKRHLTSLGLTNGLNWSGWFLKAFTFWLIFVIILMVALKVNFFPSAGTRAVFYDSGFIILAILFLLYICALITFCFMISTLFTRADYAAGIGLLLFFVTYLPFYGLYHSYHNVHIALKVCSCLFLNTALCFGIELMILFQLLFEDQGDIGAITNRIFKSPTADGFIVGYIFLMLVIDCVLYYALALLFEYINSSANNDTYEEFTESYNINTALHELDSNRDPTITILQLQKEFGNTVALHNFSLKAYEHKITVLVGSSTSGKSTLVSVLSGTTCIQHGDISIHGKELEADIKNIRMHLGICPQENILFQSLTVSNHFNFYEKFRPGSGGRNRIIDSLKLWDLQSVKERRIKDLPYAMRRRLCIALAFFGSPKVILLDEPTAGMQVAAKNVIWKSIKSIKKNKTILVLTKCANEAEMLGDKIGFLDNGNLLCSGSAVFLKNAFGIGYLIIMDKLPDCKVCVITTFLEQYVPGIGPEFNVGYEISYILPKEVFVKFPDFLNYLNDNKTILRIGKFAIVLTSLKDVYNRICKEEEKIPSSKPQDLNIHKYRVHNNTFWKQMYAQYLKHDFSSKRSSRTILLTKLLAPTIIMVLMVVIGSSTRFDYVLPELILRPLKEEVVFTTSDVKDQNHKISAASRYCNQNGFYCSYTDFPDGKAKAKHELKIEMKPNGVTLWFNQIYYHAPATAMAIYFDYLAFKEFGGDYEIVSSNNPFLVKGYLTEFISSQKIFDMAVAIGFAMVLLSGIFSIFYIRERRSNFLHLQYVSGANIYIVWLTAFLRDFAIYMLVILYILFSLVFLNEEGFQYPRQIGRFVLILISFSLAMLPMVYLCSAIPHAFVFIILYTYTTGVFFFMEMSQKIVLEYASDSNLLFMDTIMALISPHYCLCQAIYFTATESKRYVRCHNFVLLCMGDLNIEKTCWLKACAISKLCCTLRPKHFAIRRPGILRYLIILIAQCILFFLFLLFREYKLHYNIYYYLKKRVRSKHQPVLHIDEDVLKENKRMLSMDAEKDLDHGLFIRDLTKIVSKKSTIDGVSVGVRFNECFTCFGNYGSGKSKIIKMLLRQNTITFGDVFVQRNCIKVDTRKAYNLIGYCRQYNGLMEKLSPREILVIFASIRGYNSINGHKISINLADHFRFTSYLDTQLRYAGREIKRKLSIALTVIGDPPVIILDEPTAGLSPTTKLHIWESICKLRARGKSILLMTNDMQECEAVCTRLSVISKGRLVCLGSSKHLRNRFAIGYYVHIKLYSAVLDNSKLFHETVEMIQTFVFKHFTTAVLHQIVNEILMFYIMQDEKFNWTHMFSMLESAKRHLPVEDYGVGQSSLEAVAQLLGKTEKYPKIK